MALAVPLFSSYVLNHYERTRPESATPLLSLQQMITNAGLARIAADAGRDPLQARPLPQATSTRGVPNGPEHAG